MGCRRERQPRHLREAPVGPAFEQFFAEPGRYFLDANTIEVDGLCLAGLSGVVGRNPGKPWRRPEALLAREARRLADGMPDLLVMHDGPCGSEDQPGWPAVTAELERAAPTLVVRGHEHWDRPLATLANGTQVLNVDSRVVVLRT